MGYDITSSWLYDEETKPSHLTQEEWWLDFASRDLNDIDKADLLIMDNDGKSTSGGRYVELGWAFAKDKTVFIVGKNNKLNFGMLANDWFDNWDELLQFLEKEKAPEGAKEIVHG